MKKKIGSLYRKQIVIGDKNLLEDNEIHIDDLLGGGSGESDEIVSSDFFYFYTGTYEGFNSRILINFANQTFFYEGEGISHEITEIEFISPDTIVFKIQDGEDGGTSFVSHIHSLYPKEFKVEIVECYDSNYWSVANTGELTSSNFPEYIQGVYSQPYEKIYLTRCKLKITTAKGKVWYIVSKDLYTS